MSPEDISKAIQNDILPQAAKQQEDTAPQAPTTPPPTQQSTGLTGAISDIGNAVTNALTPSSEVIGSAKKGILNLQQGLVQNQLASLMELQAADKEKYGELYQGAPASELDKISDRDKAIEDKLQTIRDYGTERAKIEQQQGVNPLTSKLRTLNQSPEYSNSSFMDKLQATGHEIASNPEEIPGWIASVGLESLPSSLAMAASALAARFGGFNPAVGAGAVGASSAFMEFGSEYADLRAQGMPHQEAWEKASVKSGVIGLFDAASAGEAGHAASAIIKDLEKGAIKAAAKETGKEVGIQALYGMGGEALGSIASNQQVDPISVLEEGVGEIFGAPFEAVGTFKAKQQETINARNELARLEELKNADHIFTPQEQQEFDALRRKYEPENAPPAQLTPEQLVAAGQGQVTGEPAQGQGLPPQQQQQQTTPPVVSAAGTPIPTMPLNSAEQQAKAQAAAPITPSVPKEKSVEQRAEELKAEYNIPHDSAVKMALQEKKDEELYGETQAAGAVPGANQPSVPVSGQGTTAPAGAATPSTVGLASPVSGTGGVNAGEEVQPNTLIPPTQEAPVKPKGKRGRPPVIRTPEEAAAALATKREQTKTNKAANARVEAAKKVLEEPIPKAEDFDTPEAFKTAEHDNRVARNQALEDLHTVATSATHKNNKAGQSARVGLDHPSITPQERMALTERVAFKKQQAEKATTHRSEITSGEVNTKYNKFSTVQNALNHIMQTGTRFEKALARRLAPLLNGVQFIVVNDNSDIPNKRTADGTTLVDAFKGATGMYVETKSGKYIMLRGSNFESPELQGLNNATFLHEALHAATIGLINKYLSFPEGKAPASLQKVIDSLHAIMKNAEDRYIQGMARGERFSPELQHLFNEEERGGINILEDLKEFVTYGMTNEDVQRFLLDTRGEIAKGKEGYFKNLFDRFVNTLRSAFGMEDYHQSGMQDLILVTEGLLRHAETMPTNVTQTEVAAARKKKEKVDKNLEKVRLSNSAHEIADAVGNLIKERDFESFKDLLDARFKAMGNDFISKLIYTMQSIDLIRWKGDEIPALKELDELAQKMSSMKLRMQHAFARKADQLGLFIRKNKGGMRALSDTMHLARLESVTPTQFADVNDALANDKTITALKAIIADPNTDPAKIPAYKGQLTIREKGIRNVFNAWEKLGKIPGGHDMYRMVRQFYKDNYTLTRTLLDEKIEKLDIEGSVDDPSTPKGKLMLAVRRMEEATEVRYDENGKKIKSLPEEYFPFAREGTYWLRVNAPTGREFWMFENGADRNLFQFRRARELGVDRNDTGIFDSGDDIAALRRESSDSSAMLKEMFSAIDESTAKGLDKDALKDQLYQVYLMTLPERSFRKQFLHADNVTGFSADIFRNFKNAAMRLSTQAARLKYGDDITMAVQRGRDTLSGNPDKGKLELFVNELGARAKEEINPPVPNKWANHLNQIAYYWLLTAPASAAVQMASIPIMVMPTLNQQYGYGASATKLGKYINFWKSMGVTTTAYNGDVTFTAPSIRHSKLVHGNPILERAFEELTDRGVTTLTNTSVLTNRNRTPENSYAHIPGVALRNIATGMSALFNGAERISREMTAMMVFELEYAKNKDFDAAIDKSVELTHELLGRYDNFNRPRILRNFAGRTLGQFKMYAVNVTSFFVRNGYNVMHHGLSDAEGRAAMERLVGTLVMGGMFHGLVGMPLYSVICSTIDAVMNNLGDDEERRKRRAKNPLTSDNSNLRFRYEYLPQHFGNIQITGLDGQKHGLNELLEKGPVSALTDMNIGSRTSFDGLWFRDSKVGKTNLETVQNMILANLGPGASTAINMVGAIDDFNNGQIQRGLEKLAPAFFKGPIVAERIATEGAETKKGDAMLKPGEVSTLSVVGQALGFQPTKMARLQEEGFETQRELVEARNKRSQLLQNLDRELLDKEADRESIKKVFNQIAQYNKRYPMEEFLIDADVIDKSIDKAIENKGITFRGQQIKEKLAPYLIPLRKAASPVSQ
jgi:hypothetical protein